MGIEPAPSGSEVSFVRRLAVAAAVVLWMIGAAVFLASSLVVVAVADTLIGMRGSTDQAATGWAPLAWAGGLFALAVAVGTGITLAWTAMAWAGREASASESEGG